MRWAIASTLLFAVTTLASAGEPVAIATFQDWQVYSYEQSGKPVCYIFSKPQSSQASREAKRDAIYFMVTHWPARKVYGEVSTIIGYPFKEGSEVTLQVGDKSYSMPTSGDSAWVPEAAAEAEIIAALKNGSALKVKGTSSRGTVTTDSYSLAGFTAAMDKIDEACK